MKLRDYQQRAIDQLYAWFSAGNEGNPCLVLPTGSGKSHIVAALCKDAIQNWPDTRVLMLTHVKELIEQNAEKMRQHWPNAPMGIYSASLGQRTMGEPITFAGIQSVRNRADQIGHVDLVVIDECFVSGTKISTPKGSVDIDKVRCGDLVFNARGVGSVESISCRSVLDTFIVELDNGRQFECTGNHSIFTERGWKKTEELEVGEGVFSVEDMSRLWERVQTLGEDWRQRESEVRDAGGIMGKAELLLCQVCKEIEPDDFGRTSKEENKGDIEANQASAYQAWRKRAITSFASFGITSCARGRVGCGIFDQDKCWASERCLSKLLQSGHLLPGEDGLHRTRRRNSYESSKERHRHEEGSVSCRARVASVSRVKRESPVLVFNLQVSGHPSYFANGVMAHNCHLVSHKDEGGYRTLIADLQAINPALRVVGLTATPYRLGHGMITDKPAIFDALIEPVAIEELVSRGYLCTLRSKVTKERLETTGLHKRGGDYIEAEMQAAFDTQAHNASVVQEVIALAGERKSWLFFCSGVDHAEHVRDELILNGVVAECVTGKTPKSERERILMEYKRGEIRALTNANVLTTGFDHPGIDLIAMLRATMSPGLYVQMAGRGLRIAEGKQDCLVLDFAGVVQAHGPITAVEPPGRASTQEADKMPPVKECPECGELVAPAVRVCPACGTAFPEPERKPLVLRQDDIMGINSMRMDVQHWRWRVHVSRTSGKEMLAVTYYPENMAAAAVTEYLTVLHEGYAGDKAILTLHNMAYQSGALIEPEYSLQDVVDVMNESNAPHEIEYRKDGKFYRVIARHFPGNPDDERRHPVFAQAAE